MAMSGDGEVSDSSEYMCRSSASKPCIAVPESIDDPLALAARVGEC